MLTTRFSWAASATPAAQNSPEKYSLSPPSYRCGNSETKWLGQGHRDWGAGPLVSPSRALVHRRR